MHDDDDDDDDDDFWLRSVSPSMAAMMLDFLRFVDFASLVFWPGGKIMTKSV